ncbi:cytochrome P450 [Delitschia confertaspora ATCC 74209]|uniref:Cytochrome P450 n=1 Tax=Delitschia confertaspora ATCC 74209 TaxID=1513339 RepID=A0A9P4MME1_9PLEO|nr:cytochrome P450 [Delitschia confertaspora ATCC 74209]
MTSDKCVALLALVPLVVFFLYTQLMRWRFKKYAHLPQLPKSFLLGHLGLVAELYKKGDGRRHIDYIFNDMFNKAGRPEILLADIRPINYGMLLVGSHEVADQCTRPSKLFPYSVPKSKTIDLSFRRLIGARSILTMEEHEWKILRKRFNHGFAPQHLITLLPQILEKTLIFMSKLDALAASGEEFDMDPLCTDLTFDIIGAIVMNLNFGAQEDESKCHPVVKDFRDLISTFSDTGRIWLWLNIPIRIRRILASRRSDASIKQAIRQSFSEVKEAQKNSAKPHKNRSVVALALEDTETLTPDILQSTADQMKTFLFAGHDTTAITLQRLFYALSTHPKCLAAIRAEHDAIFGNENPEDVFLTRPDETLKSLTYTSACIKEALRLWPPAASARMAPPGSGFKVKLENGDEVCLDGTVIYLCQYIIHRDPKVYGESANDFVPERWLGDTDTFAEHNEEAAKHSIPKSAWRPFERGPRNCIGQELANLEARVILACVMRRYDFTKVGAGEVVRNERGEPVEDRKGEYKVKSELFNSMMVTSKPFDKCRMKINRTAR